MTDPTRIKNVIMILSGKGGVGKSTISVQLALSLVEDGKKVGLLDIDICGPSVPQMLGLTNNEIEQGTEGWLPVTIGDNQNLKVMSIAFLLKSKNDAVIWRGPKKHSMIKQFSTDVYWEDLDYLIIDTPPGTSDEHMSIMESLQNFANKYAILVTTPQIVSIGDVRREITFCEKLKLPILGLVENMSSFECPNCQHCTAIFSSSGGELLSKESNLDLLAKIKIDPNLTKCAEDGQNFMKNFSNSITAKSIEELRNSVYTRIN